MYDPLIKRFPKPWQGYPHSFWSCGIETPVENPLCLDGEADIAIIGAGFTGLSCAYHLANQHPQLKIAVIESNSVGWGASGRNGGFVLPGTGRLSLQDMEKKWGKDTSKAIYKEYQASINTVEQLIESGKIDCDKTTGGFLKLAHTEKAGRQLQQQVEQLQEYGGIAVNFVEQQELQHSLINNKGMHGGLYYPQCYAINPLKLAQGYHRLALSKGVKVYTQSPVTRWTQTGERHQLQTNNGRIVAHKVVLATNGYTGKGLNKLVENRHFPVISSIMVTQPLTDTQLQQIGMKAGLMAMDTRSLKYYYRLLPDNRLLFGGRGAIQGKEADHPEHKDRLVKGLYATFPGLNKVHAEFFWSGWISASYDNYPRIWHSQDNSIHYAMGYCGSGVAFASHGGKRLAQNILDPKSLPDLPYWQSGLKKFPFARFRRTGLKLFYRFAK